MSFVENNPIRYTDPTGHRNCQEDGYHCPGWAITPGQLTVEYREKYGDQIDRRDSPLRDNLSAEIEDYMKSHSNYNPWQDPYFDVHNLDHYGKNTILFQQIRDQYWMNRCGCISVGNLEKYYDYHDEVTLTAFNPSKMNWTITGLDSASLVLNVASLIVAPEYDVLTSVGAGILGGISDLYSGTHGDFTGASLSAVGLSKPPLGPLASGASVIRDFSRGFYEIPYIPPVER